MENPNDNESAPSSGTAGTSAKPARKRPAPRKAPSAAGAAKAKRAPATRKPVARRKVESAPKGFEGMLRGFADRATKAGASLSTLSGEGMKSARRALGEAGTASKSTIDRITKEWKKMDPAKRAQFIAALLGALAAASAPLVRSKMKKR